MFKRPGAKFRKWLGQKLFTIIVCCALLGIVLFVLLSAQSQSVGHGPYDAAQAARFLEQLQLRQGAGGNSTQVNRDGVNWSQAAQSNGAVLWFDPASGQIALQRGETWWAGNPGAGRLGGSNANGLIGSDLASPLNYTYVTGNRTNRTRSNTVNDKAVIGWQPIEQGVGIRYTMESSGFAIYVEYTLDGDQLVVSIPQEGIAESGDNRLISLEVLPFFGAVTDEESPDGYLFVPDGPGGIIRFARQQSSQLAPYDKPIYDYDPTSGSMAGENETGIAYPVYGMNTGDGGFISIIESGFSQTNVFARLAAMGTGFNQVNAKIILRRSYMESLNKDTSVQVFENAMNFVPYKQRNVILDADSSGYVGMATAYRDYLIEERGVKPLGDPSGPPPLYLNVLLGATKQTSTGNSIVTATTLKDVGDMAERLRQGGVGAMQIGLEGWQKSGAPGELPQRFPVNSAVGGASALKQLATKLRERQIGLRLDDSLWYAADKRSGFNAGKDAAREITGAVRKWQQTNPWAPDHRYYLISPQVIQDEIYPQAEKNWSRLGISGIGLQEIGGFAYSDFSPKHYVNREDTIGMYQQWMSRIKQQFGSVTSSGFADWQGGSGGGFAWNLGYSDHLFDFPLDGNYRMLIDEQVPFYPIAVHGLTTYSGPVANLRPDPAKDRLRAIEYGAVPSFLVTERSPAELRDTNFFWLYSSQFGELEAQILEEYRMQADAAADVWGSFITGHRQLQSGVYETVYANGRTVWVNYTDQPFRMDGHEVKAGSYAIVERGGSQ